MDERFAAELRTGLVDLIGPVHGAHPRWATSPAAARVAAGARTAAGGRRAAGARSAGGARPLWRRSRGIALLVAAALLAALLAGTGLLLGGALRFPSVMPAPAPESTQPTASPRGSPSASSSALDAIPRRPRALVSPGRLTVVGESYPQVVGDPTGVVWGFAPGHLVRFDPASGAVVAWTVADDAAFGAPTIVAARGGGVWLVGPTELAWFDGERLRDVVRLPAGAIGTSTAVGMAEAASGRLWATGQGHVWSWDGTAWTALPDPPSTDTWMIAVDADGRVWVPELAYPGPTCRWVAYFDGSEWRSPDAAPAMASWCVQGFQALADGTVWVLGERGVARFDGRAWAFVDLPRPEFSSSTAMSVALDGTVWVVSNIGTEETGPSPVRAASYDGSTWTVYGTAEGLPSGVENGWTTWPGIVATEQGIFVGTGAGIYRLGGGRFERAVPAVPAAGGPIEGPGDITSLVAVSRDEAWAQNIQGVWRWRDGRWTRLGDAAGRDIPSQGQLRIAPDGTAWVAGSSGVRAFADDRWTTVDAAEASSIAFAPDGTAYVGGPASGALRTYRRSGDGWTVGTVPASTFGAVGSILIDRAGAPWIASTGGWGPDPAGCLAHLVDGAWQVLSPSGTADPCHAGDLRLAPDGAVWLTYDIGVRDGVSTGFGVDRRVARFHGTARTAWGAADGLADVGQSQALAIAPDGTAWVAATTKLAYFDGERWRTVRDDGYWGAVSVAPDGSVWAVGPSGLERIVAP